MTLQWILISLFGCISGYQILLQLHSLRVISVRTLERAKICLPPFCFFFMFWVRNHAVIALLGVFFLHLTPFFMMISNQISRKMKFRRQILPFLDEIVLKMRAGKSLRETLKDVISQNPDSASSDLRELSSLICFPENKSQFALIPQAKELLIELQKMDQSRTRVIERLRSYRQKERIIQKFRQKSGQVTNQVRTQALVCSVLYFALLIWTLFTDSSAALSSPVLISLFLFFLGLCGFVLIGRSFRWKF